MTTLGVAFLAVSSVSLLVYVTALRKLLHRPPNATGGARLAYRGLLRTSASRVVVASAYTTLGAVTAFGGPWTQATLALGVFTAVQLIWQANAVADVRLKARLADIRAGRVRHRKTRRRGSSRCSPTRFPRGKP